MILTCPECSARYVVDPTALLPDGRTVRCAKCKHSWRESAPDADTPVVDVIEAEDSKTEAVEEDVAPDNPKTSVEEGSDATEEQDEEEFAIIKRKQRKKRPRPMPKGSNLPALKNHKHGDVLWGWYGLVGFIAIVVTGFLIFQTSISAFWPPSLKLYRALGLENHASAPSSHDTGEPEKTRAPFNELFKIENTVPSKTQNGRVITLKVKGNIANLTDETLPLPLLKISLKNTHGEILREWSFKSSAATISKGEKVPFLTSLPNPPRDATSISVTFAEEEQSR